MTDRVIIVSGSSMGVGAATSRALGTHGAHVVMGARSRQKLERVAEEVRRNGGEALVVPVDVSHAGDCQQLVQAAMEWKGRVDALVNNAAVLDPVALLADSDAEDWHRAVAVNLMAPVHLIKALLPELRRRQGRIINISSGAAVWPIERLSAYCVTKAALNHLSSVLAMEEETVTVLSVHPGEVDTALQDQARREGFVGDGPLIHPDAAGEVVAILALHAPPQWSGHFCTINDDYIQPLRYSSPVPGEGGDWRAVSSCR
jgi:NAD(P)-dependent dehydrogenase (short-subunit alcohol dehydrogenase family)